MHSSDLETPPIPNPCPVFHLSAIYQIPGVASATAPSLHHPLYPWNSLHDHLALHRLFMPSITLMKHTPWPLSPAPPLPSIYQTPETSLNIAFVLCLPFSASHHEYFQPFSQFSSPPAQVPSEPFLVILPPQSSFLVLLLFCLTSSPPCVMFLSYLYWCLSFYLHYVA